MSVASTAECGKKSVFQYWGWVWQHQFVPILKLSVATTIGSNIEAAVTQAFIPGILQTVEDIRPGNKLLWRTKH